MDFGFAAFIQFGVSSIAQQQQEVTCNLRFWLSGGVYCECVGVPDIQENLYKPLGLRRLQTMECDGVPSLALHHQPNRTAPQCPTREICCRPCVDLWTPSPRCPATLVSA
jgi:hypothetical protein